MQTYAGSDAKSSTAPLSSQFCAQCLSSSSSGSLLVLPAVSNIGLTWADLLVLPDLHQHMRHRFCTDFCADACCSYNWIVDINIEFVLASG